MNSKSTTTEITPYQLTYGYNAILPIEISVSSLRMPKKHFLSIDEYQQSMLMELHSVDDDMLDALNNIELSKTIMAKTYNKHVKSKQFVEGDLIW